MTQTQTSAPAADKRRVAIYPGTFDPITNGHVSIIKRGLRLFDKIIVTLAENPAKKALFSLEERVELVKQCFGPENKRIEVASTRGLTVQFARECNAQAIIRGLRAVSDFDYELQLALMNRKLERKVETVFLMTSFRWIYISSTIIKEAACHGGDVSGLVPAHVLAALKGKCG